MNTKTKQGYDVTKFDRPSVTVDVLIFTIKDDKLNLVLVKRGVYPFEGRWALPGGFVRMEESLEEAAKRELQEETGVKNVYLEQLSTFGDPKRDPRTRVITIAYMALVPAHKLKLSASTDVSDVKTFAIGKLPPLAFDHKKIVETAICRLQAKIQYSNIVHGLLPDKFRLSELQKVYELILGTKVDKRNFRKKMLSLGILDETGQKEIEGAHRPAMLYKFNSKEVVFFD